MKEKYTPEFFEGKKFNSLTYLAFSHRNEKRQAFCHWQCDCGNKIVCRAADVALGKKKSCNCFKFRKKDKNIQWSGHGEISGNYWYSIKSGASHRKIKFNISIEDIWKLFLKQNRKCALSGTELNFETKCRISDGTASLDRIDNSKGYVIGNIQWVHKDINFMKRKMEENKFVEWCKKIALHHA